MDLNTRFGFLMFSIWFDDDLMMRLETRFDWFEMVITCDDFQSWLFNLVFMFYKDVLNHELDNVI